MKLTGAIKSASPSKIDKFLRNHGFLDYGSPTKRKIYDLYSCRSPWWHWGKRLTILVQTDRHEHDIKPKTWFYKPTTSKRMRYTNYPVRRYFVTKDRSYIEDGSSDWTAIGFNQDGELTFGRQYWGEGFYGLDSEEQAIALKYLVLWKFKDWFGLRTWLSKAALYQSVHTKKPFACHSVPPKHSGGYSHWYCNMKKGHAGLHGYNSMKWDEHKLYGP